MTPREPFLPPSDPEHSKEGQAQISTETTHRENSVDSFSLSSVQPNSI